MKTKIVITVIEVTIGLILLSVVDSYLPGIGSVVILVLLLVGFFKVISRPHPKH